MKILILILGEVHSKFYIIYSLQTAQAMSWAYIALQSAR